MRGKMNCRVGEEKGRGREAKAERSNHKSLKINELSFKNTR
jgi:hypothetical protein